MSESRVPHTDTVAGDAGGSGEAVAADRGRRLDHDVLSGAEAGCRVAGEIQNCRRGRQRSGF